MSVKARRLWDGEWVIDLASNAFASDGQRDRANSVIFKMHIHLQIELAGPLYG